MLDFGADFDSKNTSGLTPVFMAAACNSEEAVLTILQRGASHDVCGSGNVSLLHVCAENGMMSAVEAILQADAAKGGGSCTLLLTDDGNLPIHYAAMSQNKAMVELLRPMSGPSVSHMTVEDILEDGKVRLQRWEANSMKDTSSSSSGNASTAVPVQGADAPLSPVEPITPPASEEAMAKAELLKIRGNELFQSKDYAGAVQQYTEAILLHGNSHILWSNRSAALLGLGDARAALRDAEVCRGLQSDWPRGCYRLASALLALGRYEDAAVAALEGCKLDPQSKELRQLMNTAIEKGKEQYKKSVSNSVGS